MPERNGKRKLVQLGDEVQRTEKGLEIPVPKTEDIDRLLRKAARKQDREGSRSDSHPESPEPS